MPTSARYNDQPEKKVPYAAFRYLIFMPGRQRRERRYGWLPYLLKQDYGASKVSTTTSLGLMTN
jgi:hypothetical protein